MKDARSPEWDEGTIFARAVHDPQYLTRWISRLTKDWDRANVRISCFEDYPSGGKSKHVMITFDADTFDLLETT